MVGASGSGKSTLLAILAGLDTPSAGQVALDGADLFGLDEDQRAELRGKSVGFVFQSFQLLPSLTALENVMLPLELRKDPEAEPKAREILDRVGLRDRLGHYPKHLSGGEQQRVALARAFSVRPKLLFADEPTGSLDAEAGSAVIDLVFDLNRSFGTTLSTSRSAAGASSAWWRGGSHEAVRHASVPQDAGARLARRGAAHPRHGAGGRSVQHHQRGLLRRSRRPRSRARRPPVARRRPRAGLGPSLAEGRSRRNREARAAAGRVGHFHQHGDRG